eukprot:11215324-Ditylum_brightwellii.AAC.1
MHHQASIEAGQTEFKLRQKNKATVEGEKPLHCVRKCVNLDAWIMGSKEAMIESFHRHSAGADICIVEGCMGLYDSKDGTSDEGSTAQIAKLLNAAVVLVIDGSMMARSAAAMAFGYTLYDADVRLSAVVVNKVGGCAHIQWLREAIEISLRERLTDVTVGVEKNVCFAGAMPNDAAATIPERHLGLVMPSEKQSDTDSKSNSSFERYMKLAYLVEEHLNLNALLDIGQTHKYSTQSPTSIIPLQVKMPPPKCQIGIADDEAFCFYYQDNLHLLQMA